MNNSGVNKKKVFFNVFSSGGQVVFTGLVYFLLYRLLLERLNIERLGVWSVVLSTSSLANLANFGISSSVTRFVSSYSKNGETQKTKELIFTSSLFLFLLFSLLGLLIFPFAELILEKIIDKEYMDEALTILPFSILCFVINAVAGVYSSVLEGLQRNYVKSIILSLSSMILLACTYFLTSGAMGLKGVAIAQVIQCVFGFAASVYFAIKFLPHNPLRWRWSKTIFKEIFSYGVKFQLISISTMFNDPLTKILLAKFGGLQFTGYYEMANRLVSQFRGVIASANQSLIPVFVTLDDQLEKKKELFRRTFLTVYIVSLITFASVYLASASISIIWIGEKESIFILTLGLLCFGYFFNLVCGPAYFSEISLGKLNLVLWSHFLLSACNVAFGAVLGFAMGGKGVILGWIIALVLSSIYLTRAHNKKEGTNIDFFDNKILWLSLLITSVFIFIRLITSFVFPFKGILQQIALDSSLTVLYISSLLVFFREEIKSILPKIFGQKINSLVKYF